MNTEETRIYEVVEETEDMYICHGFFSSLPKAINAVMQEMPLCKDVDVVIWKVRSRQLDVVDHFGYIEEAEICYRESEKAFNFKCLNQNNLSELKQ